jgi:hypothetical protein
MLSALRKPYRNFSLHIRCESCLRETVQLIEVPPGDDSPEDEDELLESGFLANLSFRCPQCESPIGRLFGINQGDST